MPASTVAKRHNTAFLTEILRIYTQAIPRCISGHSSGMALQIPNPRYFISSFFLLLSTKSQPRTIMVNCGHGPGADLEIELVHAKPVDLGDIVNRVGC